jgi:hypothetical protein
MRAAWSIGEASYSTGRTAPATTSASLGGLVQAGFVGVDHDLDAVAELELHEDLFHVAADGGFFDDKFGGDFAVRESAGDVLEDVSFAWRERVELGVVGEFGHGLLCHAVDDPAGD